MTRAHVIAAAIGGRLQIRCLCEPCNSRLGHQFEGALRLDPTIRHCTEQLAEELPQALVDSILRGARWVGKSPYGPIELVRGGDGELTPARHEHEAGWWREAGDSAEEHIRNLVGTELDPATLEARLEELRAAGPDVSVRIGSVVSTGRTGEMEIQPSLDGPRARDEAMVATAYLFLCGALGERVFREEFDDTRALLAGGEPATRPSVEVLLGRKPRPWHGIRILALRPNLLVEVVCFGCLVYQIAFPALSDDLVLIGYKIDLATGQDSIIFQAEDGDWYVAGGD